MYHNKYILGLDIGISSVGWGLLALDENDKPYRIIDVGSRIFAPGEIEKTGDSRAKERREKRGARRVIRRREFRVDRVRNLLHSYGYLKGNIINNMVSEKNNELTIIYEKMLNEYYKSHKTNPYKLKVEALERPLEPEELSIVLVHYAKKRGYKSNRETSNEKDSGKVLEAITENKKLMQEKKYRTISEMYITDEKFATKIKNSPEDYKVSVTREMYLDEITKVLDSQIKYGQITEDFKNSYLEIWSSQRNYSKGPGGNSPYGGDLIAKMVGKCNFDEEPRAPKYAPSSEIFVALTKLLNLRYKSLSHPNYISLEPNQINMALSKAKEKKNLTFNDLKNIILEDNLKFKDLQLPKKDYLKLIEELKKKLQKDKIEINNLTPAEKELYNIEYEKKLFSKAIVELKGYNELKDKITKCFGKDFWEETKENLDLLDELALYCTNYKLNEDILAKIKESPLFSDTYADLEFIKILPNFKDHLMLSINIIRKLIPLMLAGKRYDEAMMELNYIHYENTLNKEKKDLLIPITKNNNITNQRVIRSLTQTRKIINALIKKYGSPKIINIETARELAKTLDERKKIKKKQDEKQSNNEKIKKHLVELGLFPSPERVTSTDILKYNLWQEQQEFCAYSQKKITINDLYEDNMVQIDHILPYSRTFNDNYLNKTLVLTKENQDKGNKTPFEWFGNTEKWEKYETFINNLNISSNKKDNYLLQKLDFETEREMRSQNLNDTKYISRELASFIKAYLNVEKVNVYQGSITAKLRARWGFNRLTHSYISETYFLPEEMKSTITKDRDNHLHHAMDALVIASITPSLQQEVTYYEKYNRYIDNLSQDRLKKITDEELTENKGVFYNDETGEINEVAFKDYLRKQTEENHIYFNKHHLSRLKFPLPYENFVEEAKIRVYEQDIETLKWKLKSLSTYTNEELNKIHTLIPSIAKVKVSGAMHEETYHGLKKVDEKLFKTSRKPLTKIKLKDLESIPDKEGGSKDIYNALKEWLGNYETGEEALKAHNGEYPTNPNDIEHKPIKKIKVYELFNNTGHMVNGSNVDKGGIYRIDILKSKDQSDEKLYAIGYDIFDIRKIEALKQNKSQDNNFLVKIEYGQKPKYKMTTYQEIIKNYEIIHVLNKNDLVKIRLKDGRSSIVYIVGFTNGQIEVKSTIGDGYDIIGKNQIFSNQVSHYKITISTILSIEKLSINILGEINGLSSSSN